MILVLALIIFWSYLALWVVALLSLKFRLANYFKVVALLPMLALLIFCTYQLLTMSSPESVLGGVWMAVSGVTLSIGLILSTVQSLALSVLIIFAPNKVLAILTPLLLIFWMVALAVLPISPLGWLMSLF